MLLTLYYVAATWLQSWRLNFMRSKVTLVRKNNGSILLYKDDSGLKTEGTADSAEGPDQTAATVTRKELQVQGIATSKFIPLGKSQVGDILWFTPTKKSISLFPLPVIDVSEWISVSSGKTIFPIALKGSLHPPLSDLTRLHLLLEADFCAFHSQIYHFHVEDFGVPKAWHADDLFSLLIETDEDHLTRLATSFMLNSVSVGHGLELIRIQSVEVTGNPCLLLNSDWEPVTEAVAKKIGMPRRGMTATQWHNHVIMLRNFSQAANEAVKKKDPIPVNGQRGSVVVRGPSPVQLSSPTVIDMHLVGEKEVEEECKCPSSPSISLSVQHGSNSVEPSSTSASSFGSIPRLSTDTLIAASPQARNYGDRSGSITSLGSLSTASVCSNIQPRVIIPHQPHSTSNKPPNVIIFSESSVSVESVKAALNATLNNLRYTVYALNLTQMLSTPWLNQASLVVICGSIPMMLTPRLLSYTLQNNGRLLCLCSDLLGVFLPIFRTAEVRPEELVTFSYSSWKHVRMMHHIFCYQQSPTPAKFSQDEQSGVSGIPSSVEVQDNDKKIHKLDVQVLGAEETWRTPSLLSASTASGGKIIFSQVHLEVDPLQYENDEIKLTELRGSNKARLEILTDLLSNHLGLQCSPPGQDYKYTPAYFLGVNELKMALLEKLKSSMQEDNTLKVGNLLIKFCGKNVSVDDASKLSTPRKDRHVMPVLMYACPDTFSTVEYFENLATDKIGRLVIYSQVMTSSMAVLGGPPLVHGLAVIPRIQTKGVGRGGNAWISPEGCAMYSLQLQIPLDSVLGRHIPLVQHLTALATVSAICSLPDLQGLDLGLKWPNDIYASRSIKIGGSIVSSTLQNGIAICNIGTGFNLNNKEPTTCLNEMISELNKKTGSKVPPLSFEKYFAITFTETERLINLIQTGHLDDVISLYYKYWLHSNAEVSVVTADGASKQVIVIGIDNYGFLRVQDQENMEFTVQPDGNSFDMLQGLIVPKIS